MSRKSFAAPAEPLPNIFEISKDYTDLDSEIERGEEEEATEAYILVRRGDDDEVNKVI